MTNCGEPVPVNDNSHPLSDPDAMLAYLHGLHRQLLAEPIPADAPISWWRERKDLMDEYQRLVALVLEEMR